ncbi:fatty acid desaturase [Pseudogemmatithrix spongiicola]|uniref:Fatty acid desaturase n=1 Tax=Pseudogemmatithrix spongiicola TaxID=3062599 RepID=A0AA49Q9I8_9BACT|nr:fatty acid desaturase [Gemmatimonadaceae bacterium 'strain 138']WKW16365.1 fatty acid desaturase [Gemmatimonadaceae bacterium 'strain 318']
MAEVDGFDPYQPYRSTLLTPERVRALSQLRPGIVVRDAVLCWATIIAAWTIASWDGRAWVCLLAAVFVGSRYYALYIMGHDGLHRRLFPTRAANDRFNDLVILGPIGAITRLNNRNHLAHHQYLGHAEDPDRFKHACFNKSERLELAAFLVGITSVWRAAHNVLVGNRATGDGYTVRDLAILGGWQVALIGGLTAAFGWWGYPLMWLLPVFVFTYLADLCRSFLEHSHPEADATADHHRLITFESNAFERWFLAPMHMNLHVAHHLWVGIPYYNLPVADAEMSQHPLARELERRGSYLAYLWRYWRALPLDECKPAGRLA